MEINENKIKEIKNNIECLLQDWEILSFKDKKYRINSIQWKLNLAGISPKKMSAKNKATAKIRLSKTALNNFTSNITKN